jgi:hypothetical protein
MRYLEGWEQSFSCPASKDSHFSSGSSFIFTRPQDIPEPELDSGTLTKSKSFVLHSLSETPVLY